MKRKPTMKKTCEKIWMLLFLYSIIWRTNSSKKVKCKDAQQKLNRYLYIGVHI